jgi:hypothetical protein
MNALRDWWRHRNDPPPTLPDPVTRTDIVAASMPYDRRAWEAYKRRLAQDGWTYISHRTSLFGNVEVTLRRYDGEFGPDRIRRGH